jgi:hypothetical protein
MIVVEVLPNPNCEPVDQRVFINSEEPRAIAQVHFESSPGKPEWFSVTGWTVEGKPCAAMAAKVEDSGSGVVTLVFGGDAGLRLRPRQDSLPWRLDDPAQLGVPFLLLDNPSDVRAG